jgi:hypothetical protein
MMRTQDAAYLRLKAQAEAKVCSLASQRVLQYMQHCQHLGPFVDKR